MPKKPTQTVELSVVERKVMSSTCFLPNGDWDAKQFVRLLEEAVRTKTTDKREDGS